MKKLLLCMFILVNTGFLNAQQDTVKLERQATNSRHPLAPFWIFKKKNWYKIQLQEMSGKNTEGYLTNITDEEVFYETQKAVFRSSVNNAKKLNYAELDAVKIQEKDAVALSFFYGLFGGASIGVVAAIVSDKNFLFADDKRATAFGFVGGLTGSIVGLIVGMASKQTFKIGGKKEKHNEMKFDVLQKIYGAPSATVN